MTRKNISIPIVIIAVILIAVFVPLYGSIDDGVIVSILDGRMTGTPSTDTIYMGVLFSGIMAGLYRIIPAIQWFGVFQLATMVVSICVISRRLALKEKTKSGTLFLTLMSVSVFLGYFLKYILMPTYTLTAGFLAATGLVILLNPYAERKDWKEYAEAFVFFLLAYELRDKVCFMAMPFVLVALCTRFLYSAKEERKAKGRGLLLFLVGLLVVLGLMVFADHAHNYRDEAHTEYMEYNKLRTEVFDYYNVYEDDAAISYYEEHGLNEKEIAMDRSQLLMLREDFGKNALEVYAEYGRTQNDFGLIKPMLWAIPRYVKESLKGMSLYYNIFYALLFLAFLAEGIRHRKQFPFVRSLLLLLGVFACRSVIMLYLMGTGRYPERVTVPLYLWEMVIAVSILKKVVFLEEEPLKKKMPLWILLGIFTIFAGMYSGLMALPAYRYQYTLNRSFWEENDYLEENQERFHLLDPYAFCNATERVFRATEYLDKPDNTLLLGGWLTASPMVEKKLMERFGKADLQELMQEGKVAFYTRKGTQYGPAEYLVMQTMGIAMHCQESHAYETHPLVAKNLGCEKYITFRVYINK